MAEAEDRELRARKDRERTSSTPSTSPASSGTARRAPSPHEERVEIAYLPQGAVAMRSSLDHDTVLRYTEAEWRAFVLGARDGEFDLEPAAERSGGDIE
ncbi:hypothetical protein STENM327S_02525 [Streptomyces tendae]